MKNWFKVYIDHGMEGPREDGKVLSKPLQKLINRFNNEYFAAGSPRSLAIFAGAYAGFTRQLFYLPPSAGRYCMDTLSHHGATLGEEPEPHDLLKTIAGSEQAFETWCPWANKDSIQYPRHGSGTMRMRLMEQRLERAERGEEEPEFLEELGDLFPITREERSHAVEWMREGRFDAALPIFVRGCHHDHEDYGLWLMAAQCFRFTGDLYNAIKYYKQAARLDPADPGIFLSLGIAFQLYGELDNAVGSLVKAIELDGDFDLAFDSLALTQMKRGEYEMALHNYDEALKAVARKIVRSFENSRYTGIVKHHNSACSLWTEYAIHGLVSLTGSDPTIDGVAMPTSETAEREEREETHEGLFWKDATDRTGKKTRYFLPNYFTTFEALLHAHDAYSRLLRGKGSALRALGRKHEALRHYEEAEYYQNRES